MPLSKAPTNYDSTSKMIENSLHMAKIFTATTNSSPTIIIDGSVTSSSQKEAIDASKRRGLGEMMDIVVNYVVYKFEYLRHIYFVCPSFFLFPPFFLCRVTGFYLFFCKIYRGNPFLLM